MQGLDRFAYVNNNPLRYTDPSGHNAWAIAVGVGALVGAGIGYASQVYSNYQNGITNSEALTTNISPDPIIVGGFIGAGAVLAVGLLATSGLIVAPAAAGGLACNDGDCTNEVRALIQIGEASLGSPEAQSLIEKIANEATINPNSQIVSLGSNEYYQMDGFTYFELPVNSWNELSRAGIKFVEAINDQFMITQTNLEKEFGFTLSPNINNFEDMGYFSKREFIFLEKNVKYIETIRDGFNYYFAPR